MTTDVIYLGDCISGMAKQVEDASVDLVIADPPHYRAGKQGEARFPSEEAYFAFSQGWHLPRVHACSRSSQASPFRSSRKEPAAR